MATFIRLPQLNATIGRMILTSRKPMPMAIHDTLSRLLDTSFSSFRRKKNPDISEDTTHSEMVNRPMLIATGNFYLSIVQLTGRDLA